MTIKLTTTTKKAHIQLHLEHLAIRIHIYAHEYTDVQVCARSHAQAGRTDGRHTGTL